MPRRNSVDSNSEQEKEKKRKRRLWMIQQKMARRHERRKQKKIEEYERERTKKLGLSYKGTLSHTSRSRSRSRSEESRQRSHSRPNHSNGPQVVHKKINSTLGNKPLFNGPSEAPKLSASDLSQVTVKIHRKIPAPTVEDSEIKRDVNPEEITLKRRKGEGMKPIFDREELKAESVEVEERRTIEASGTKSQDKRPRSKRRSVSLSLRRHRSPSPHSRSERSGSRMHSHRSRHEVYSRYHLKDRHYEDRSPRRRSHSRERDCRRSRRDYSRSSRSEEDYRKHRDRSKERSYDHPDRRDSFAERHHSSATAYREPMPYPVYFRGFPPRPLMIPPAMQPYPPRFIPPPMYRGFLPPDRRKCYFTQFRNVS